jgi:hypothetical protein
MTDDVLKLITGKLSHVVILTHDIDFLFVQSLLLPRLRKCGHPSLTVFADADVAARWHGHQSDWIEGLGRRYRVVPVRLPARARFHAKAIMLAGFESASLLVGSGNLTFGGWRDNAEVWSHFTSAEDSAIIQTFRTYLDVLADGTPLSHSLKRELAEAFGAEREWTRARAGTTRLLTSLLPGPSLIEQVVAMLPTQRPDELVVCSPYFDPSGDAAIRLCERTQPHSVRFLIPPKGNLLSEQAAARLSARGVLSSVLGKGQDNHSRFVHAKFFAFRYGGEVRVFAGSANCSIAAMVRGGGQGNVEMLASQVFTAEEFDTEMLSHLDILPDPPVPIRDEIVAEAVEEVSALLVLAARYEYGVLRIAFRATLGVRVEGCMTDDRPRSWELQDSETMIVRCDLPPRYVVLRGTVDGVEVSSPRMWVDNEASLLLSSRQRELANAVYDSYAHAGGGLGAFNAVLSVFRADLEHLDSDESARVGPVTKEGDKPIDLSFDGKLIFSDSYSAPITHHLHPSRDEKDSGLRGLLLRSFRSEGFDDARPAADPDSSDEEDAVERIPGGNRPAPSKTEVEKARSQGLSLLRSVSKLLIRQRSLELKPLGGLLRDLRLAGKLFALAAGEKWVAQSDLLSLTSFIWNPLFFSSSVPSLPDGPAMGWLGYRFRTSHLDDSSPEAVSDAAVSLALWTLSVPTAPPSAALARFTLSAMSLVAEFPWLWAQPTSAATFQTALAEAASLTNLADAEQWPSLWARWCQVVRSGLALRATIDRLRGQSVQSLAKTIKTQKIVRGDILWQGKVGLCVSLAAGVRRSGGTIPVLPLQDRKRQLSVSGELTVPIAALPEDASLGESAATNQGLIRDSVILLSTLLRDADIEGWHDDRL